MTAARDLRGLLATVRTALEPPAGDDRAEVLADRASHVRVALDRVLELPGADVAWVDRYLQDRLGEQSLAGAARAGGGDR